MPYFPEAHGGVVAIAFGDDNSVSSFPGFSGRSRLSIITANDETPLDYAVTRGPSWVDVDADGQVSFDVPASEPPATANEIRLFVANSATGIGRSVDAEVYVVDGELLVDTTIDASGGVVSDTFGDIAAEFPANAVATAAQVTLYRGRDKSGNVLIGVGIKGELLQPYSLHLADSAVLEANTPASTSTVAVRTQTIAGVASDSSAQFAIADSDCIQLDDDYRINTCWATYGAEFDTLRVDRRLPSNVERHDGFWRSTLVSKEIAAQLQASVTESADAVSTDEPVLFVHGYIPGFFGLGGATSVFGLLNTWDRFPELIDEIYLPFEFRWKTNARFQDVADNLGTAIEKISDTTGKKVHIVAHSFGGVLVRTLLQGLSTSGVNVRENVASVTTIGSPHSGIFKPADPETPVVRSSASLPAIAFPNGQDNRIIETCGQLSCYQMGKEDGEIDDSAQIRYGVEDTPGSIAHRLVQTRAVLDNSDIPLLVLIGLTTDNGFFNSIVDGGDALISYEGQRYTPDATVDQSTHESRGVRNSLPLTNVTGSQYNCDTKLVEAVLGFGDTDIRPGQLGLAQPSPESKYGYRHTGKLGLLTGRGSSKEVGIDCEGDAATCTHDTWVRTRDYLAKCDPGKATLEWITMSASVVDENDRLLEGVELIFRTNGRTVSTKNPVFSLNTGPVSATIPFQAEAFYEVTAIPPAGSGYRAASLPCCFISGVDQDSTDKEFPPIKLVRDDAVVGMLTGNIRDADTLALIPRANYTLVHSNLPSRTGTAAGGSFLESGLVPGMYELTAEASGYLKPEPVLCYLDNSGNPCDIELTCGPTDCATASGPGIFPAVIELSSLDGTNGFVINGIDVDDESGWRVSNAGDVNADGIDDLVIGARQADPNGLGNAGESYVVFGRADGFATTFDLSSLDGSNGFALLGRDAADNSGRSVSGAGDVNGDGIDDLIIGADTAGQYGTAGEAYVVFGRSSGFPAALELSSLNGSNGFILIGDDGDHVGTAVSGAGDVNSDGFDDVIIGAPFAFNNGNTNAGEVYIIYGRANGFPASLDLSLLDGSLGSVMIGDDLWSFYGDTAGYSVSGAGDVNSDGFDDVIIGASGRYWLSNTGFRGGSYVVFGGATGMPHELNLPDLDGTNGFALPGVGSIDSAGVSVSGAGDVNGDGISDLLIGAYKASPNGRTYAGVSYLVYGRVTGYPASFDLSSLDGTNGFALHGVENNDGAGLSVSDAGDVNSDGIDDLIIGAPNANYKSGAEGNGGAGASYVVFGRANGFTPVFDLSTIDGTNGFRLNGIDAADFSGYVSSAGDVNGDGVDDLIIGGYQADPNGNQNAGESYVVFGRSAGGEP
jgi:hypothetical protein